MTISVAVVGGSGYTGIELLRLLALHPQVDLKTVTSRSDAGTKVSDQLLSLRGHLDIEFVKPEVDQLAEHDCVFFATPHGICMEMAPTLMAKGVKVIDLGADFRIQNIAVWESAYAMPHTATDLLSEAVYGLPEIHRDKIKRASLVANPGCYPTATLLGIWPLLKNKLINPDNIIIDAKSGVSGAGRSAKIPNLYAEVAEDFRAYGLPQHRHTPEIAEQLSLINDQEINPTFVPHLLPMIRGILNTIYLDIIKPHEHWTDLYQQTYANEAFVDVLSCDKLPNSASVRGSNVCRLAVQKHESKSQLIVLSTIDNLIKGAAGQAIQNMNLMFGINETTGLLAASVYP